MENAQCGVLSFDFEGLSSEEAALKLSERGFALRAGMHCAPEAHKAAGTYQKGTVRLSFSVFSTSNEIIKLTMHWEIWFHKYIIVIVKELRIRYNVI
jgi:selenocysteine lyase/cysteine desulfurase